MENPKLILKDICRLINPKLEFHEIIINHETIVSLIHKDYTKDELINRMKKYTGKETKDILIAIEVYQIIAGRVLEQWKNDGLQIILDHYKHRFWDLCFLRETLFEDIIIFFL